MRSGSAPGTQAKTEQWFPSEGLDGLELPEQVGAHGYDGKSTWEGPELVFSQPGAGPGGLYVYNLTTYERTAGKERHFPTTSYLLRGAHAGRTRCPQVCFLPPTQPGTRSTDFPRVAEARGGCGRAALIRDFAFRLGEGDNLVAPPGTGPSPPCRLTCVVGLACRWSGDWDGEKGAACYQRLLPLFGGAGEPWCPYRTRVHSWLPVSGRKSNVDEEPKSQSHPSLGHRCLLSPLSLAAWQWEAQAVSSPALCQDSLPLSLFPLPPAAPCGPLPPPCPISSSVGVWGPSPRVLLLPAAPPPHLGNRLPSLPGPLCRHQTLHVANGGDFLLSGGTWKVLSCLWVFFFPPSVFFPPSLTQLAVSMPLNTALGLPLFSACVHLLLVILHGAECQEMT